MFLKNKLDINLRRDIEQKYFKKYRVVVQCNSLIEGMEKKIKALKGDTINYIEEIKSFSAYLPSRTIERLIEYPEIKYITYDEYAYICGKSVALANKQINGEKYKLSGKGIGIGLIDTGVYPHSDLLYPTNKIKYFKDLIKGISYPYDDNGHGSATSGIISGSGHLSKGNYKGIAPSSHLVMIKAFDALGKGYISDILYGINLLIKERDNYNIKVICLPFELQNHNFILLDMFSKLFDIAIDNNIIIIVPSGSQGDQGSLTGIAQLSNCITVAGLDSREGFSPYAYSSSGNLINDLKPDLSAAAVDIVSLNTNPAYISERGGKRIYTSSLEKPYINFTGTSSAAAYVSGVCAMLFENNPNLSYKDLVSILKLSCESLDNIPKSKQGSGIVCLDKLLP
jgi:serine protease AprX